MKIARLNRSLSVLTDFIIMSAILFILAGSFAFVKALLFSRESEVGTVHIKTEVLPISYSGGIRVSDTVFDTLTKRKVGTVAELSEIREGDRIYFLITLDTVSAPRSAALRTQELWFEYIIEE